jgi:hypothetical protein
VKEFVMHFTSTWTRSFAVAVWLMAKGYELEAVEKAKDGSGGVVYRFPLAAQNDMHAFHATKTRLNTLTLEARERQ